VRYPNLQFPIYLGAFMAGLAFGAPVAAGGLAELAGAQIYQQQCASCHGSGGQGVAGKFEEPLYGSRSIESLQRLIERTMPEGEPEACVGEDARQVAEYIYDEFYSPEARRRKGLARDARLALVRMTATQHRNAVADLLAHFTPAPNVIPGNETSEATPPGVLPGLRAEYFQSKGMNKADSLQIERVDRRIDFDFGEESPGEGITADQFAIIWEGAVWPRATGHYEFRVRTENGARLYLNDDPAERIRRLRDDSAAAGQVALIDDWVSSGERREKSARVFLLGGRPYPLRLEFFKYREASALISLEWKPPNGAWSLLDHNHLTTAAVPRTFVLDTPFPADDRSRGYERGSSLSRAWQSATMNAAAATAAEVVHRLPLLAGFEGSDSGRDGILKDFVARFASVAFRRPLTGGEEQLFRETLFTAAANPEAAVRRAIMLVLMSPSFLYPDLTPEDEAPAQHTVASRLSFALWDSIPDKALLEAAGQGRLATMEQIESEARRMISDPRARAKMREFLRHWLELGEHDLSKDSNLFPEFDEAVIADLRHSLELFVEQVIWSESSDYRQLLLADYLPLNDRLRRLYDPAASESVESGSSESSSGSDFELVSLSSGKRAGVLTHPYLLSAFAYPNNTSPIHRGVFLTRNIMGRPLRPPPVAVAFKEEEFPPEITMREKITQLTSSTACMSCHSIINPLGFALENFDPLGRWRDTDNNLPVDTLGEFVTDEGDRVEIGSALDVARFAAEDEAARRAFVNRAFVYLVKQDSAAYGPETLDRLLEGFEQDNFNIRELLIRIAVLSAAHSQHLTFTSLD
jgi:mono/diheme cytochrome c family protein